MTLDGHRLGHAAEDVPPWTFRDTMGAATTIVFPVLVAPLSYTSFSTPLIPVSGSFTAPCSFASISTIPVVTVTFAAILAFCAAVAVVFNHKSFARKCWA